MFENVKAALLRGYYRLANWWAWRGEGSRIRPSRQIIDGPAGPLPVAVYQPPAAARFAIVYFHGGGWVIGDLRTHQPFCQQLSQACSALVVAVDYRLAPRHRFPAAIDDCVAASNWVLGNLQHLAGQACPVIVAGDSAGGNLAAVVAREVAGLAGQLLIYPVTQHYSSDLPSYREKAKGYVLTAGFMRYFLDTYLGEKTVSSLAVQRALPGQWQEHKGLPPALVLTAEHDPLRDEGKLYAQQLTAAGVPCEFYHHPNEQHGFACSQGPSAAHTLVLAQINNWLQGLLKTLQ